jgi:hypothetical protein
VSTATSHVDEKINPHDDDNMEDGYDDIAITVYFAFVAFTSPTTSIADLSNYWVVEYACSVSLIVFFVRVGRAMVTRVVEPIPLRGE